MGEEICLSQNAALVLLSHLIKSRSKEIFKGQRYKNYIKKLKKLSDTQLINLKWTDNWLKIN